jgi:nicotinate-nucleotide adenylyltransferase
MNLHPYHLPPPRLLAGKRIGILGGTFDPCHKGHRHLALWALKKAAVDAVWLLVSPQNPLKKNANSSPLPQRLASCTPIINGHPRLHAAAYEQALHTRFTLDTLTALRRRYPTTDFVLLLGADCWRDFSRWKQWKALIKNNIAVFSREWYSVGVGGFIATRFAVAHRRWSPRGFFPGLSSVTFFSIPWNPLSSTTLRMRFSCPIF